ncbi:hypothetical protein P3X46_033597 [Hevea brasiliensis]|uniref:Uncharacterized protein n=1 Tax=Hevea brasiliensis TaxID=3981 RepID=A0ABQ9KBZ4_HEVBR|nr:auxin-responsive protein SAUR20 [Hevea brasiliensis]KAJ9132760.1 hypothetical protein P3X46_033597 [Hevea brasiliensis]
MGIRLPSMISSAMQILKKQSFHGRNESNVPKGHVAVYVGEFQRKRFIVPISYLNHPCFRDLLNQAEEEFGFNHPMGALTIPCKEDTFIDLTSRFLAL